jgi:hypothetical protein
LNIMSPLPSLGPTAWTVALGVVALNVPFGFWRAGTRRFTLPWFLAVHVPVPIAVGLRMAIGLGWRLSTLPLFVAAFFAGQFLGGRARRRWTGDPAKGARTGKAAGH